MSEDLWYYLEGGAAKGPVRGEDVRAWIAAHQIDPKTPVARVGWNEWKPVSEAFRAPESLPPLPGGGVAAAPGPRAIPPAEVRQGSPAPMPSAPAAQVAVELRCISGPDTGRTFWIGPSTVSIDRRSGLLDPYLGEVHAILVDGRVRLTVASGHSLLFETRAVTEVALGPGEQIQIGTSLWKVGAAPIRVGDLFSMLGSRLNDLASVEKLEGFSLREMFSEVFTRRSQEEIDEYFLVGTAKTTPPLSEVQTGWPKPWLFGRVLLFLGFVYLAFFVAAQQFGNPRLLPGLILMGSIAVPFATLILFYELNTPRNVSFRMVLTLFFLGGVGSLFVSLIGFSTVNLSWLGASSAGIIEELGKLATVILIVRGVRYHYTLNGLLFGAAVGAGFAAFESAGYAFWDALMAEGTLGATVRLIVLRGLLSPFAHVAWTAIAAGAFWRAKGGKPFSPAQLFDPRFLKTLLIPVVLHMLWNSPLPSPLWSKHVILGVVGWFVLFGLVQQGLRQVKQEQAEAAQQQIETTKRFMRLAG